MLLTLNSKISTPLYIQVYKQIKDAILAGHLLSGSKLPSKRILAEENGISQNTVINGYQQLLIEGYIYSKERKGYYVSEIIDLENIASTPIREGKIQNSSTAENKLDKIKYDLTQSNPDSDIFPFQHFRKINQKLLNSRSIDLLKVTSHQGMLSLRLAIQQYLNETRAVPCQTEQIIVGPNSQYLLNILLRLISSIRLFAIENPGYQGFNPILKQNQKEILPVPLDNKGINMTYLAKSSPDIIYLTPNHQYPTGSIMPLERRYDLLQWLSNHPNKYIIEDDYDSEFKYSGIPIPSLKSLDNNDRVIYMGSFSRVLAPSIRLSYMVLPRHLLADYQEKFVGYASTVSTFIQFSLKNFIEQADFLRYLNKARSHYKKKRELFIQSLKQIDPNVEVIGEPAGLYLLFNPSFSFHANNTKIELYQAGIKIKYLSDNYVGHYSQTDYFFISFSLIPLDEIKDIATMIYKVLENNQIS